MLILTRKLGESIVLSGPGLSEDITVLVTTMGGTRVGLGITAPTDVLIRRGELNDRRKESSHDDDSL
jgi:carbon storage regulator